MKGKGRKAPVGVFPSFLPSFLLCHRGGSHNVTNISLLSPCSYADPLYPLYHHHHPSGKVKNYYSQTKDDDSLEIPDNHSISRHPTYLPTVTQLSPIFLFSNPFRLPLPPPPSPLNHPVFPLTCCGPTITFCLHTQVQPTAHSSVQMDRIDR